MSVLLYCSLSINEASKKRFVRFDLDELLEAVRPTAAPLRWSVFELWALLGGGNQVFLGDDRVVRTDGGRIDPSCGDITKPLSFSELLAFARFTNQVVDGLFVGVRAGQAPPTSSPAIQNGGRLRVQYPWFLAYPVVLHACDSTFWRVFLHDESAADEVRRRIPEAETVVRW